MRKLKVIFKFIQSLFWIVASFVGLVFTLENTYCKYITPNYEGLFDFKNIPSITETNINEVISSFNVNQFIFLWVLIVFAFFTIVTLIVMIIRNRIYPFINIILFAVNTAIFFLFANVIYYVAIYKGNATSLWQIMLFKGITQENIELGYRGLALWGVAILTAIAVIRYLILGFRIVWEANTKKSNSLQDQYARYFEAHKGEILKSYIDRNQKGSNVNVYLTPLGSQNNATSSSNLSSFDSDNGTMTQFVNTNKAFSDKILSSYNNKGKVILLDSKEKK